jgi:hypothetical protein
MKPFISILDIGAICKNLREFAAFDGSELCSSAMAANIGKGRHPLALSYSVKSHQKSSA